MVVTIDLEAAQRHLNQILSVKPTSWEALAQLVEVQWRRGKLAEAEQALDNARLSMGEQDDPGMDTYYALELFFLINFIIITELQREMQKDFQTQSRLLLVKFWRGSFCYIHY